MSHPSITQWSWPSEEWWAIVVWCGSSWLYWVLTLLNPILCALRGLRGLLVLTPLRIAKLWNERASNDGSLNELPHHTLGGHHHHQQLQPRDVRQQMKRVFQVLSVDYFLPNWVGCLAISTNEGCTVHGRGQILVWAALFTLLHIPHQQQV